MSKTKTIIDEQCGWESLTLDQKLEKLQEILFNANTEVYGRGGDRTKKIRKAVGIEKLKARRQVAERNMNRLSLSRARKN